jgi:hypothetical protein
MGKVKEALGHMFDWREVQRILNATRGPEPEPIEGGTPAGSDGAFMGMVSRISKARETLWLDKTAAKDNAARSAEYRKHTKD